MVRPASLTPITGSPFAAGDEPVSVTTTTARIPVTPPTITKAFSPAVIPGERWLNPDFQAALPIGVLIFP
jgi:hypothetical protein